MKSKLRAALVIALCLAPALAAAHAVAETPKAQAAPTTPAAPTSPDGIDKRWMDAALKACQSICQQKALGKAKAVVPDTTSIDIEKCDNVDCQCDKGKAVMPKMPNGSFCQRWMIVAPPFWAKQGTCQNGHCYENK